MKTGAPDQIVCQRYSRSAVFAAERQDIRVRQACQSPVLCLHVAGGLGAYVCVVVTTFGGHDPQALIESRL